MPTAFSPQNLRISPPGPGDHDGYRPSTAPASSTGGERGVPVIRPIIGEQPNPTPRGMPLVVAGTSGRATGRELATPWARIEEFLASLRALEEANLPARAVLEKIESPIQELKESAMATRRDWLTRQEAMMRTGRSAGYFEDRLASFDGRSRLEVWREEGLAEQTRAEGASGRGVWLIHTSALGTADVPTHSGREIPEDDEEMDRLLEDFLAD